MAGPQAPGELLEDPSVRLQTPGSAHEDAGLSVPSKRCATATPAPQTLGEANGHFPPSRRGMQIRAPGSSWDLPAQLGDGQFLLRCSGPPPPPLQAVAPPGQSPCSLEPAAGGRRRTRRLPTPHSARPRPVLHAGPAPSRPQLRSPATVERRRRPRDSHGAGQVSEAGGQAGWSGERAAGR